MESKIKLIEKASHDIVIVADLNKNNVQLHNMITLFSLKSERKTYIAICTKKRYDLRLVVAAVKKPNPRNCGNRTYGSY